MLLVGDGPERDSMEDLCRKLKIDNSVKFLGKTKDIQTLMSISDVFILPSEKESFGLVALEAMASGIPVISSNAGGLSEINVNQVTGFLSNVGNVEEMAKNTLEILKSEESSSKFKKNAFEHSKQFNVDKILPLYEELYKSLILGTNAFTLIPFFL